MKKSFVFAFIFCLVTFVAYSAPDNAAHFSKEANFRLSTLASWDRLTMKKVKVGKNPAWLVQFCPQGQTAPDPAFALKIVDGRENEDIKQTCLDFAGGTASLLLVQFAEAERASPSVPGFMLTGSEVKKYGRYEYMLLRLYSPAEQAVIYRALTAADGFLYSFNYKQTIAYSKNSDAPPRNLEIMLSTLEPYNE